MPALWMGSKILSSRPDWAINETQKTKTATLLLAYWGLMSLSQAERTLPIIQIKIFFFLVELWVQQAVSLGNWLVRTHGPRHTVNASE